MNNMIPVNCYHDIKFNYCYELANYKTLFYVPVYKKCTIVVIANIFFSHCESYSVKGYVNNS